MLYYLNGTAPNTPFPNVEMAMRLPNGLLAVGGDLRIERLLNAYRHGIFPWYGPQDPILWWSPDPRLVLFPKKLHISRSLGKTIRRGTLTTTVDQDFAQVIRACANVERNSHGTWLITDMIRAYEELHAKSLAHSIEVWANGDLVGGLYGVALGRVFFGESMFSYRNDASKIALVHLVQMLLTWGYELIDCQVRTEHLLSMGAEEISRRDFNRLLTQWI